MTEVHEFAVGYKEALKDVEKHMTELILKNNGATTPIEVLNVFNGMALFLHEELRLVRKHLAQFDEPSPPIEARIEEALIQAFPGFEIFRVTKGEF